jgi:hypothetical protein
VRVMVLLLECLLLGELTGSLLVCTFEVKDEIYIDHVISGSLVHKYLVDPGTVIEVTLT